MKNFYLLKDAYHRLSTNKKIIAVAVVCITIAGLLNFLL
jgi:hypothetical protein